MAGYLSDYGKYLEELRQQHPEWEAQQREGLFLLWNKKVDLSELQTFRQAADKQKSYPYDVNF